MKLKDFYLLQKAHLLLILRHQIVLVVHLNLQLQSKQNYPMPLHLLCMEILLQKKYIYYKVLQLLHLL